MYFRGDADGVHLVGDWPHEMPFWPHELGALIDKGLVAITIKVNTVESWALYRVSTGNDGRQTLRGKRIRRGREKASA